MPYRTQEEYQEIANRINSLSAIQEAFPERAEILRQAEKAKKMHYKAAFDDARESGDWDEVFQLKNVLPRKEKDPEEIIHKAKLQRAIERAKENGDWSYALRLAERKK